MANKLSVQFADIGAQEGKNIPNPVDAFMVSMKREDGTYPPPPVKKPTRQTSGAPNWLWTAVVLVVCLAAIGVGGFLYFTKLEIAENSKASIAAGAPAAKPMPMPKASTTPMMPPMSPMPAKPMPSSAAGMGEKFMAETVPFVADKAHQRFASDYVPAAGENAL